MRRLGALVGFALLAPTAGLAQDSQVYEQREYLIDGWMTNCGEAQTIVATHAPLLIQEQNLGLEILIDNSRFDPLPTGVKLFVYYQVCTNMFFLNQLQADSYATSIGLREGWLTRSDIDALCQTDLVPLEWWPDKPNAERCATIAGALPDAR